jgi:deoxycytidine triphosphate deaminase
MQLTGEQIVKYQVVTNHCEEGIQQQGVDVRLDKVFQYIGGRGFIPKEGKTALPKYHEVDVNEENKFVLMPGYYEVEFMEGCEIMNDCAMYFKTRSSLVRCGSEILSGQFDGGFKTDKMGAFLKVEIPIIIEKGARVAQMIVHETYLVEEDKTYNGQWQGDKQRNS